MLGGIYAQDNRLDSFPRLYNIACSFELLRPRHLGEMNQAFNARLEFYECAKLRDPCYCAAHALADRVFSRNRFPRMRLELLHPQRNPLFLSVDLQDPHFNWLTHGECI